MKNDIDFIKEFNKINLTSVGRKLNINTSNVCSGKINKEKLSLIKIELYNQIEELMGKNFYLDIIDKISKQLFKDYNEENNLYALELYTKIKLMLEVK